VSSSIQKKLYIVQSTLCCLLFEWQYLFTFLLYLPPIWNILIYISTYFLVNKLFLAMVPLYQKKKGITILSKFNFHLWLVGQVAPKLY
jgi:hypothetical protein